MIVIGSVALNWHKQTRVPSDVDIVATYDDASAFVKQLSKTEKILCNYPAESGKKIVVKTDKRIVEIEVAWESSSAAKLLELVEPFVWNENLSVGTVNIAGVDFMVPCLDVLLMIKESHKYKKDSIFFNKTMDDILLMRGMGASIPVNCMAWFKEREKETYTNKLPKLNQSREAFFDNSNDIYTVSHDCIHEAVKHLDRPAYEYFKENTAEVFTSKELFFKCSREVQLYAALEEVQVLSIERAIFPFNLTGTARRIAFDKAHMKLASSISGGWFREFVWNEYHAVQGMYSEDYVAKFYDALYNGRIKKFNSDEIYRMEKAA